MHRLSTLFLTILSLCFSLAASEPVKKPFGSPIPTFDPVGVGRFLTSSKKPCVNGCTPCAALGNIGSPSPPGVNWLDLTLTPRAENKDGECYYVDLWVPEVGWFGFCFPLNPCELAYNLYWSIAPQPGETCKVTHDADVGWSSIDCDGALGVIPDDVISCSTAAPEITFKFERIPATGPPITAHVVITLHCAGCRTN